MGKLALALSGALAAWLAGCGGDDRARTDAGTTDGGVADGAVIARDGGDGGGGTDAGPPCMDREEIPDPVTPTLTVARSCPDVTPCDGALEGTFAYADVCGLDTTLFEQVFGVCSATILTVTDTTVSGTLDLEAGTYEQRLFLQADAMLALPNACHGCRCGDMETSLRSAGFADASCNPTCAGGVCYCTVGASSSISASGSFTVSAGVLETDDGRRYEVCPSDTGLELEELDTDEAGFGSATLVAASAVSTPEICDGVDNDGDGTADAPLVECPPPCTGEGVCAEGGTAGCAAGEWTCAWTSRFFEPDERTCDSLDNDCDGLTDEDIDPALCVEVCDGRDNDGDGDIDEELTDTPPSCDAAGGICGTGDGTASCAGVDGWACDYGDGYERAETTCNGVDDDCDEMVDEGCDCAGEPDELFLLHRPGGSDARVVRVRIDGTDVREILPTRSGGYRAQLLVDPLARRLYTWDALNDVVERADFDGSGLTTISMADSHFGIDPGRGLLYIGPTSQPIDGSGDPEVTESWLGGFGLLYEPVSDRFFFSRYEGIGAHRVVTARRGGSETVLASLDFSPESYAYDPTRGHLYYGNAYGLHRLRITGGEPEQLVEVNTHRVAISLEHDSVFYASAGDLYRWPMSGGSPVLVLSLPGGIDSIAVASCPP